jgi:hypothetical protein
MLSNALKSGFAPNPAKKAIGITALQFGGTEHVGDLLFEQAPEATSLALSDPFVHHAGVDPAKPESVA